MKRNKINIILTVILSLLVVSFILSFTKSCSVTDRREMVKSALVNKKYEDKIISFQFKKGNELLTLDKNKENGIWYVKSSYNPNMSLPADTERVNNLITDLISVQEMYKLSDSISENSSFGLNDNNAFTMRYYFSDGFNDVIFGNQDFALSSRYIMSGKSTAVYEISNIFDKYLSTSVQSWTEPYIISKQILGNIKKENVQRAFVTFEGESSLWDFDDKLLDLRHGGFPSISTIEISNPLMTIKMELGNRSEVTLTVYKPSEVVETEYDIEVSYFDFNKNKTYKSYSKISGWTYNKILDITGHPSSESTPE